MKRLLTVSVFVLIFSCAAFAQKGIIFKVPDDVFPMDWNKNGFKGLLMLRKDSPSGIFIGYPKDDEKIEDFRTRIANFIVPMFTGHKKEDEKKEVDLKVFKVTSIPNHKGDSGTSALYYTYTDDKTEVQILFYERAANGSPLLYGYFAQKQPTMKDIWADEKGQGVKIFEKFWKTIK